MSGQTDMLKAKRVAIIASNPFGIAADWIANRLLVERADPSLLGVCRARLRGDVYSADGGKLEADNWSDPRDVSRYSAHDLISLGFMCSPPHMKLVEQSKPIAELNVGEYDALLFVGGQAPMYTFYNDERVHNLAAQSYSAGKVTAVLCHSTCILLKTRLNGKLLVDGKTWTGFANSEELYADNFVGKRIQPFWIEEKRRRLQERTSSSQAASRPTPFGTVI